MTIPGCDDAATGEKEENIPEPVTLTASVLGEPRTKVETTHGPLQGLFLGQSFMGVSPEFHTHPDRKFPSDLCNLCTTKTGSF